MKTTSILFWISLFIVFYSYLGYGMVLYLFLTVKRVFIKKKINNSSDYQPEVTLLIGAYNELDFVKLKAENSFNLDYPAELTHFMWVTDGSDDGTPDALRAYNNITVLHEPERKGKIGAINRGMKYVKTPIVIFSDANTILSRDSVRRIVNLFSDEKVGCVSGEKRISDNGGATLSGAGEGIYWKYESKLKKWDSELYSVVGAAGELFAVRTGLFENVEADTILDDFIISLRIAMRGYTIKYDPEAYATESASANVTEELKRKIRIAAGGIQSVIRLWPLLNIFKYGILSFQYISHRVLRWTVTPLLLPLVLILNIVLFNSGTVYQVLLICQIMFYLFSFLGWFSEKSGMRKIKPFFVPYYFLIMNYAVYIGFFRHMKKSQSVNWERAKRG
jgi:cellulose synthase/poly-beta-1,6-N-acetylglucosamine synthase-like glycosyltransferase